MTIFSKAIKLFKEKKIKNLFDNVINYLIFLKTAFWFKLTFKELHPDLKKTNKDWIIYNYLKSKYKKFLDNYKIEHNEIHEYSNKIWWCWFQGEENAPEITKKCLESIRKNISEKEIIVITDKNMFDYVKLPDFIVEKYKKGYITKTLLSDFLRLELLTNFSGTWIDATCYCTDRFDYALNKPLFAFKMNEKNDPAMAAQSWFICSEKNEPILKLTRDLMYEYWKKENRLIHYFLVFFCFKLATEKYPEEWKNVPWYPDLPPHIMQRELFDKYSDERFEELKRFSDIHKLSYKLDMPEDTAGTLWERLLEN